MQSSKWCLEFKLRGGEKKILENLPTGTKYRIEEIDLKGYSTKINKQALNKKERLLKEQ